MTLMSWITPSERGRKNEIGYRIGHAEHHVPSKYFKKMVNNADLWEAIAGSGSNIFRLIGFFDDPNLVILAHAFQKKTQKTPKRAIKVAEERKKDYFRGKKNE